MTILELLRSSTEQCRSNGITNPRTSCEILLGHALGMKRLELYLKYDRSLTDAERERFGDLHSRRLRHEPLQYILNETEFMSLPFAVNADVLIPRPETELLVEKIIAFAAGALISHGNNHAVRILDIGVGCGNIAVSLARYIPAAEVYGIDISREAVAVAQENARRNHVEGKVGLSVKDICNAHQGDYSGLHVIVSNPPYVSTAERHILDKSVIDYEPHAALFTGEDGLRFFRVIAVLSRSWLVDGGMIAFETGYTTGKSVRDIVLAAGFRDVRLTKDYAQLDRIVTGVK